MKMNEAMFADCYTLDQLLSALVEMDHRARDYDLTDAVDLSDLPNYGGIEPVSTIEVWSWDESRLLVGDGSPRDWEIVTRS